MSLKFLVAFLSLSCAGCIKTIHIPQSTADKTAHTHRAQFASDMLIWEDDNGFGCGHVLSMYDGRVYRADIVDWSLRGLDREAYFNNFNHAVEFVEQECKP